MHKPDIRICFLGDSYVQGTGDPEYLGWVGRVCASARRQGHNLTGYNLGVRHETSSDIALRWLPECAARLPVTTQNHVLFAFGANDVTLENGVPRVAAAQTLETLASLINSAKTRYRVLVIGPPAVPDDAVNARLESLSNGMAETCTRASVPFIALFPSLVHDRTWLDEVRDNDGAHPRATGYAKVAALVEGAPVWWFRE